MQFSSLFSVLIVAIGFVSAIPTLNSVDSNVAPYVGVANTNVGNTQGNLGAVFDDARSRIPRRRRAPKSSSSSHSSSSQPELINSPETATEASCNVGTAQCCQSLHQTSGLASQGTFGALLGASIPLDQLMVGVQCSPIAGAIPIVGGGASSCNSQPVCCSGNQFDGLVSTGCSPLTLQ